MTCYKTKRGRTNKIIFDGTKHRFLDDKDEKVVKRRKIGWNEVIKRCGGQALGKLHQQR